ncbi:MAG: MATE family efflux transporter, partial [Clostridia bacterium]|nr:MATE family efflux transporter [Clostridia bacterium]
MLGMAICWCLIRVPYVTLATTIRPVLTSVSWAYPITWTLSSVFFTIYYLRARWLPRENR